jgi:acyl-CoA thioesterase-1
MRLLSRLASVPLLVAIAAWGSSAIVPGTVASSSSGQLVNAASPMPTSQQRPPAAATPSLRLLFIGASVTAGYDAADASHAYPNLVARHLRAAGSKVILHIVARPGATASVADAWNLDIPSDVVVVHLVTNDFVRNTPLSTYQASYGDVIARVRKVSPAARLVCLGGWDNPTSLNRAGIAAERYDEVARSVCAGEGGKYVDLSALYLDTADRGPPGGVTTAGLRDSFHPNNRGHEQLAAAVVKALGLPRKPAETRTGDPSQPGPERRGGG